MVEPRNCYQGIAPQIQAPPNFWSQGAAPKGAGPVVPQAGLANICSVYKELRQANVRSWELGHRPPPLAPQTFYYITRSWVLSSVFGKIKKKKKKDYTSPYILYHTPPPFVKSFFKNFYIKFLCQDIDTHFFTENFSIYT